MSHDSTTKAPTKKGVMRTISVRNLLSHKVRLILTVLSVILGTAFVSGAFIFTDTLNKSFSGIVSSTFEGVDVTMSAGDDPAFATHREQIASMPGVAAVNEESNLPVAIAGPDNSLLKTGGASSQLMADYPPSQRANTAFPTVSGHDATKAGEAVINQSAAEKNNLKLGDKLTIVTPTGKTEVTLVGLFGSNTSLGGWAGVGLYPEQFRSLVGPAITGYSIHAKDGTSPEALKDEIKKAFPQAKVQTGKEAAEETTKTIAGQLKFINYFLLAFGAIALLVGTFIIANTFSMIVAQRLREFALLRALGASRRQITNSVIVEALIIGFLGSAIGIVAGFGLVKLLVSIMNSFDMGLPDNGLGLGWQSIVYPLAIGVIVTLLSAWAPARRAGRTHPVQAMRTTNQSEPLTKRTIIGAVLLIAGAAAAWWGAHAHGVSMSGRMSALGLGALGIIVGTLAISAALSLPVLGAFGRIIGLPFGATGKLASTNSSRNPRRTAATAFALTLGLALVSSVGMIGASMKQSISDLVDTNMKSQLVATPPGGMGGSGMFSLPQEAVTDISHVEGVKATAPMYYLTGSTIGDVARPNDPNHRLYFTNAKMNDFFDLHMKEGSDDLTHGGTLINADYANKWHIKVGDKIRLTAFGAPAEDKPDENGLTHTSTTVIGLFDSSMFSSALVSEKDIQAINSNQSQWHAMADFINTDETSKSGIEQVMQRIESKVKEYLIVEVQTRDDFKGQQASQVDQLLAILYGLLALSVVIAILGIVNTLALSVIERTQEIGMLRAVGTLRRQIRHMIYLESVQIALYGSVLGMAIGLYIGWTFLTAMKSQGISSIAIPWDQIITMLIAAAIVGVAAAVWPGIKASRTKPLEAIRD